MTHLLVIAGTDSSGGAGLSRDIATAQAFGVSVCPVVTAVTAQTHGALHRIQPMPPDLIRAQIVAALDSVDITAIKIGMLGNGESVKAVADSLAPTGLPIVLDPVLRATSGGSLLTQAGMRVLLRDLMSLVRVVTPNLDELTQLSGLPAAGIPTQVRALHQQGCPGVLVKGGHDTGPESIDQLFEHDGNTLLRAPRLAVQKRGTGCTLATAIACGLGSGHSLSTSCRFAKTHVQTWLAC